MVITKGIRIAGYTVIAAFILSFIALAITAGVQHKKIKEYKAALEYQCEITQNLNKTVNDLWGQECIRIENTIQITQKGLVTVNQANNVSRSVSEITRGELLMAMDSLERVRKEKESK